MGPPLLLPPPPGFCAKFARIWRGGGGGHGALTRTDPLCYTFMEDLKGAPAVHFNFHLQSFFLYLTFKSVNAASGETIPLEYGRFGE